MTCMQDVPQGTSSRRDLESIQIKSREREARQKSVTRAPNQMQLPRAKEEAKVSGQEQVATVKEGKSKSLCSPSYNSIVDPGTLQHTHNNPGFSTLQPPDSSKLSKTWVNVETDSVVKLEEFSKKEATGSKAFAPQATASVDGWICVERPPILPTMTWEDALKVAQRAREAVVDANHMTASRLTCPSQPHSGAAPVMSQASREVSTSQVLSGRGTVLSPLPLPPKQSPSRISQGSVKARISAFESSVLQGPDALVPKLENEKTPAETTIARISIVAHVEGKACPEKVRQWESEGRNKQQSTRDATIHKDKDENRDSVKSLSRQESCKDRNQGLVKNLSKRELPREDHRVAKDQEPRFPDGCQPRRTDKHLASPRLDAKVTSSSTIQGEDIRTAYRLPKPQDENAKAIGNLSPLVEEGSVCSMEERLSQTPKGKVGNFLNEINWKLASPIPEITSDKLRGEEEEKVASNSNSPVVENDTFNTKYTASEETRVITPSTPEKNIEIHYSSKVKRIRNQLGSPKSINLDKPKTIRQGGSLQAWKDLQDSLEHKAKDLFFLKHGLLKENLEKFHLDNDDKTTPIRVDDAFLATIRQKFQMKSLMKEKSIVIEPQPSPPILLESFDDVDMLQPYPRVHASSKNGTCNKTRQNVSNGNNNKIISCLAGNVKQVLGGVVIIAGLFVLWPRKRSHVQRYHVVKIGETLANIAPDQCIDPSSHFCKILNPQICEQKTIYPGQQIRLS